MEEYNNNAEFKSYVDKYCNKHNLTPEHLIVKLVEQEYRHQRLNCKI